MLRGPLGFGTGTGFGFLGKPSGRGGRCCWPCGRSAGACMASAGRFCPAMLASPLTGLAGRSFVGDAIAASWSLRPSVFAGVDEGVLKEGAALRPSATKPSGGGGNAAADGVALRRAALFVAFVFFADVGEGPEGLRAVKKETSAWVRLARGTLQPWDCNLRPRDTTAPSSHSQSPSTSGHCAPELLRSPG